MSYLFSPGGSLSALVVETLKGMRTAAVFPCLHAASLLTSLGIIILSLFDHGILSLGTAPVFGIMTTTYHTSIFILMIFRPQRLSFLSTASISGAYILSFCWMAAFAALVFIREAQSEGVECLDLPIGIHVHIPYHEHSLQKWQFLAVPIQWVLLGDLAIRNTVYRQRRWEEELESPTLPMYNANAGPSTAALPGIAECIPEEHDRALK
ncbi:hypothetical protein BKA70DRAFT_564460 [Coprinopsis sp. MPI-PUGE-AT-0042]|nr:hypothetical protein BKA70DRAFT_564460 [Coprinopsis sp. MPI-PUGE-AT-0042]